MQGINTLWGLFVMQGKAILYKPFVMHGINNLIAVSYAGNAEQPYTLDLVLLKMSKRD